MEASDEIGAQSKLFENVTSSKKKKKKKKKVSGSVFQASNCWLNVANVLVLRIVYYLSGMRDRYVVFRNPRMC